MFSPIIPALVTPFDQTGKIDFPSLKNLLSHLTECNVTQIVVGGTTGEGFSLDEIELLQIVRWIHQHFPSMEQILNVGKIATYHTLHLIKKLQTEKISTFMVMIPYMALPSFEGIQQHFQEIAKHTQNIILYYHPQRTGVTLSPTELLTLCKNPEIKALKDASGNFTHTPLYSKDTCVLCGDDGLFSSFLQYGCEGIISVLANAYPKLFQNIWNYQKEGQSKVQELLHKLEPLKNPTGIKALLSAMDLIKPYCRLPLLSADQATIADLKKWLYTSCK